MNRNFVMLTFFATVMSFGQSTRNVEKGLFKINVLVPGVSYEMGIGENATINAEAFVGFALTGGSNRDTEFGLFPGFGAEYRQYVNFDRRVGKGKNISGNSGNYIGLVNQFYSGNPVLGDLQFGSKYYYNLAAVYGLQRTYSKGFYYGLSFGPALIVNEFETSGGLLIDARLGWVLGKNKKK